MDIPKTCKAMVLTKFNEPLELLDIPVPELKPGDMLVKVEMAGVCGTDLHLSRDALNIHPTPPILMGHETVAAIYHLPDSIKTDVQGTPVKIGDRIIWSHHFDGTCHSCKVMHEPNLCENAKWYGYGSAYELHGGYSEYVVVLAGTDFIRIPDEITTEEAVSACCAGRSAANAFEGLNRHGGIRHGEHVVITGAGPVGLFSVVMAAQSGAAKVIAVDMNLTRLEFAKKWGATDIVNAADFKDSAEKIQYIRDLCNGRGAQVVIECTGIPDVFSENLDILSAMGKYLIIGQTSDKSTQVVPNKILRRSAVVIGSHSGDIRHYIKCLQFIKANRDKYPLSEIISKKYLLSDANQALDDTRDGKVLKAALVPEL